MCFFGYFYVPGRHWIGEKGGAIWGAPPKPVCMIKNIHLCTYTGSRLRPIGDLQIQGRSLSNTFFRWCILFFCHLVLCYFGTPFTFGWMIHGYADIYSHLFLACTQISFPSICTTLAFIMPTSHLFEVNITGVLKRASKLSYEHLIESAGDKEQQQHVTVWPTLPALNLHRCTGSVEKECPQQPPTCDTPPRGAKLLPLDLFISLEW
jgi:hypothetical protein